MSMRIGRLRITRSVFVMETDLLPWKHSGSIWWLWWCFKWLPKGGKR